MKLVRCGQSSPTESRRSFGFSRSISSLSSMLSMMTDDLDGALYEEAAGLRWTIDPQVLQCRCMSG